MPATISGHCIGITVRPHRFSVAASSTAAPTQIGTSTNHKSSQSPARQESLASSCTRTGPRRQTLPLSQGSIMTSHIDLSYRVLLDSNACHPATISGHCIDRSVSWYVLIGSRCCSIQHPCRLVWYSYESQIQPVPSQVGEQCIFLHQDRSERIDGCSLCSLFALLWMYCTIPHSDHIDSLALYSRQKKKKSTSCSR